jgi:hypothetical protein
MGIEINGGVGGSSSLTSGSYFLSDVDEIDDTTLYLGKAKIDGSYLIAKFVFTGNDVEKTYANISNNATYTTYSDAWTDRLVLVYNNITVLTGV